MLSIEDLIENEYKIYADSQSGLLSHLHVLKYESEEGHHEGCITLSKPSAKILLENAMQIIDACAEVIGETNSASINQEVGRTNNYKRYDRD
jgi:hypothetical protein